MQQKKSQRIILKLALWLVLFCSLLIFVGVVAQLYTTFRVNLLVTAMCIFLVSACSLLLFHFFVTRHLESLARQIGRLDFTNPDSLLSLNDKGGKAADELLAMVSDLNTTLTRARQAYKTLAGNEERLLLFFDSTEEAIIGMDRDGICTFANDACLQLLGQKEYEAIIGKEMYTLFSHSDSRNLHEKEPQDLIRQAMEKGSTLLSEDGFIVLADGKKIFVVIRAYPVFKAGEVTGSLVFINDISEKRQLRRERELLSEAIEQVPVMILIAGSDHCIQYANGGAERLSGFARQELVGQSIFLIDGMTGEGDTNLAAAKNSLHKGQQWEGILESRSKWGKPLKFFSVISPLFDDRKQVVNLISVSREVSCEIALQKEVINTKKMEAVGRLSASFAHEFGNPLFGVRSVLRDICERITFSEDDKYLLELAHSECERMRSMVREFQHLDRQTPVREEHLEVIQIIAAVMEDTQPLLATYKVDVLYEYPENTHGVVGNKGKLFLVLRNIVVNAVESMAKTGGTLRISTVLEGEFLRVSMSDSGGGIKKEHQELIFEPFFSTKPEVEGKGIGLSVAYGAIKGLGGTLTFVSEEGKGTVFTIIIPISQASSLFVSPAN